MPVENAAQRVWLRLHMPQAVPAMGWTGCFQKDVDFPQSYRGDLIAVRTAGAYGEVMASNYNLRDHVQSVYSETIG